MIRYCWHEEKYCCQAVLRIRDSLKKLAKGSLPEVVLKEICQHSTVAPGVEICLCVSELGVGSGGGRGRMPKGRG